MLTDEKILVTGAAGHIAYPLVQYLAKDNEVWGIARFSGEGAREGFFVVYGRARVSPRSDAPHRVVQSFPSLIPSPSATPCRGEEGATAPATPASAWAKG